MDLEQGLVAELGELSGLTGRIYPYHAPEAAEAPYVVYVPSPPVPDLCLDGWLDSGVQHIDLYAVDDDQTGAILLARQVAAEVRTWLGVSLGLSGPLVQLAVVGEIGDADWDPDSGRYTVAVTVDLRY